MMKSNDYRTPLTADAEKVLTSVEDCQEILDTGSKIGFNMPRGDQI
jgi:hypothetical protein